MANNRYFNVPVTSRAIHFKDASLYQMLRVVDSELFDRENERVKITYEKPINIDEINRHNGITSQMFRDRKLPERLILVQDEYGIREIQTGVILNCSTESYLDVFEVSGMDVVDLFVDDMDYAEKADKFVNDFFLNKRKVLSKTGKKFRG